MYLAHIALISCRHPIIIVFNDHLPPLLASGMKGGLTREITLVTCQDFNHQEKTGRGQGHQESMPEKDTIPLSNKNWGGNQAKV